MAHDLRQTPDKHSLATSKGEKLAIWRALVRYFLFCYLGGLSFWMLWDSQERTLHDIISGT